MKHIKLFEKFNNVPPGQIDGELNTVKKVIQELGERGDMKQPLGEFVFQNASRFGLDPKKIKSIIDFPEKMSDLIGYYLMDGDDFWKEWTEAKNKK